MVKLPMTLDRISKVKIVVLVDLSRPGNAIQFLTQWINVLRNVIEKLMSEKESQSSKDRKIIKALKADRESVFSLKHPDCQDINPFPVPLLIVASKYDTFCNEDSIKRKVLAQALRYIAHMNGASLQAFSNKDKGIATTYRATMTSHLFGTDKKTIHEVDSAKSLVIQAGSDTFEDIGIPRGARRGDFETGTLDSKIEQWVRAVGEFFPSEKNGKVFSPSVFNFV